jgi:hypothetical protein
LIDERRAPPRGAAARRAPRSLREQAERAATNNLAHDRQRAAVMSERGILMIDDELPLAAAPDID